MKKKTATVLPPSVDDFCALLAKIITRIMREEAAQQAQSPRTDRDSPSESSRSEQSE